MVSATKVQIEEFRESLLWQDIIEEIEKWSDNSKQEPLAIVAESSETNPSTATVLMRIGHASGIQNAVVYFKGILDTLLSMKEAENDSQRK